MFDKNGLRYLYTLAYYMAIPGLLLRIWWRSVVHNREYRARLSERFGYCQAIKAPKVIWIHAVSMGETLAAIPLVKDLLARYQDHRIVMTATTPTGAAQAIKHFKDQLDIIYLPYDLPGAVNRFFDRIHPEFGIILETELWPNLLHACSQRKIPLLLANARLSERSFRGYRRISSLTQQMVNSFTVVAAQAELDAQRYLNLGLEPNRLQVTGNIKFDIQLPADLTDKGRELRRQWGGSRPVWVAASTHEGEETVVLSAFKWVLQQAPNALLVIVPRHPERFGRVGQLCTQAGFQVSIRSAKMPVTEQTQVILADTMGELMVVYAAVDVAFVGGSLAPIGGHNLIEPAILGVPVLTGPELHNFIDISRLLLAANAAKIVKDPESLAAEVIQLFKTPQIRQEMGQRGRQVVMSNTGALKKHLQLIDQILKGVGHTLIAQVVTS